MMWGKALLCLSTLHIYCIAAQGQCTDLRGLSISHGMHYVPGPDTCTLCVCDNGLPKVCKAVLCSPPQDCRSFRVGITCCEFICLDDVVKPADSAEANVRVAAGGAVGVVLLTVALVVYRVRRQKRRRPPHADDQRSLTSIGYISGSMGYMGGTCETALAAWKPPSNYLPRGEAPPPYDEVVAQCRSENIRVNETAFHRTYPVTMEAMVRPDDAMQCSGHGYVNVPRPVPQMSNPQGCYNAPLLQPVLVPEPREPMPHHPLAPAMGFPSAVRLTGSLGAISSRGLLSVLAREPEPERPHHVPGFYTTAPAPPHTALHRTIPRISGETGFARADRALQGEVRRSFHRAEQRHDAPRTMPRSNNLASAPDVARHTDAAIDDACNIRAREGRSRAHSEEHNVGGERPGPPLVKPPAPLPAPPPHAPLPAAATLPTAPLHAPPYAPLPNPPHAPLPAPPPAPPTTPPDPTTVPPPQPTLPLTVDQPSCVCSYEGASAPGGEDADDYRSECENCKAASNSRWVVEAGWEDPADDGTQTLQRRAPLHTPAPPATATLPQPVTKQSRTIMGPPSNWENWFNTIPDSDTESEEE